MAHSAGLGRNPDGKSELCIQNAVMRTAPKLSLQLQTSPDLVDQVYAALLDAINNGGIQPGERLTQEEIAERFAVSRQPVLQALRLLKRDGFVVDAPGRGVQAIQLDAAWITQVYQVRGALDALAARLAAARRYKIDPGLLLRGRKAAAGKDIKAMIDADMKFHGAIYAGSKNPLIEQSALVHWGHVRRVMGAVLQSSELRQSVWDEHEEISNAIAAGKADRAAELIASHASVAGEYLVEKLGVFLSSTKRKAA